MYELVNNAFYLAFSQLKSYTHMIGSRLKNNEDVVNSELHYSGRTVSVLKTWYKGLELAGMRLHPSLTAEGGAVEWQRLIPAMVKAFQLAREIIQKNIFFDQKSIDQMYAFGLLLPLRFLLPFGKVAAKWRLRCTLQLIRLLSQSKRQSQCFNAAAEVRTLKIPAPSKRTELGILRSTAALPTQIGA